MNKVGMICQKTGRYECSACNYVMKIKKGEKFPICPACGRKDITWQMVEAL
jgi:predicted RNA-binding Zn-ribbon protein involved in translation (DUF1610 family)